MNWRCVAPLAHCRRAAVALGLAVGAACTLAAEPKLQPLPAPAKVNAALAELGRHLFFEPRLSGDGSRSCASCHAPKRGFADGLALSNGYNGTDYFRNTPGLQSVRLKRRLMWDGRLDGGDLPTAVRDMVTEAHFMNADARLVQERIGQTPALTALWRQAFGVDSEPYGPQLFVAIAEYLKTLDAQATLVDRALGGQAVSLPAPVRLGLALFHGKARCAQCHNGPLGSNGQAYRLGVPQSPLVAAEPARMVTLLRHHATMGVPNYMAQRSDVGTYAVSKAEADRGRFVTPALRGLAHTGPYLHNGSLATLEQVVAFHDQGGGPGSELAPLGLNGTERAALVALLRALSGPQPTTLEPPAYDYRVAAPSAPLPVPITQSARSQAPAASEAATAAPQPLGPLPTVAVPTDNPMSAQKVALGRLLFWDTRLSGNGSTACVSCHAPSAGWGEPDAVSRGYPGTRHWRNSQTILNAAHYQRLFWDGAAASLERQAQSAATGAVAGNGDEAMMEMRLRLVPEYVRRFREVFGSAWPRIEQAWQAIAAFERTLVSDPRRVPFDRWQAGQRDALSASAQRGHGLFVGKARCIQCHHGALLSDQRYHALDVPRLALMDSHPLLQVTARWQNLQRGVSHTDYRASSDDLGLFYQTGVPSDRGRFRTPSLRELRYTAPYMHNGVFETLREVVEFFDRGGGSSPHKSPLLQPLGLSEQEKTDLVAFLESLSMDQPPGMAPPVVPASQALETAASHGR
ncbi:MAG: hypothetical protein IPO19_08480 [Rhodoferax sp.]|nr:hypothetical protein [Rhodoferax sp.]